MLSQASGYRTEFKSKGKKKKKKSERPDLYALIGLVNERWTATENQIKLGASAMLLFITSHQHLARFSGLTANSHAVQYKPADLQRVSLCSCSAGYRKACLEHHPDKAGAATADDKTKAAIEDKFKLIQEAYDTLSDPQRRREYDSVDDFDDSLPFDCAAADFFKVCAAPTARAKQNICLPCMDLQHYPQPVTCSEGRATHAPDVHDAGCHMLPYAPDKPPKRLARPTQLDLPKCLQSVIQMTSVWLQLPSWCWQGAHQPSRQARLQVFGPAFRRNSRWSVQQPVPEVGNEAAPWEAVNAFYDFWFTFRSWREFPHPDEEDTEQAESREERRWACQAWSIMFSKLVQLWMSSGITCVAAVDMRLERLDI